MANTLRIMRSVSNVAPTGLAQGELAYVEASGTGDGRLYIGAAGSTVEVVGGQYFIDLLNSYDADLGTFTLPANTTISAYGKTLIDDGDAATARATLGVDQAGTDNSTDVTVSGTPNYITLSGQNIVRALIDLTSHVTGDLPFSNIAQVATSSFVGRVTAATGDMEVLTATQATALLNLATISLKGLMPALSNNASEFLDGTGNFSVPVGGGDVEWNDGIAPANNALVRFDGTTGKLIQESQIIVDDADNMSGVGSLNSHTIPGGAGQLALTSQLPTNPVLEADTSVSGWGFVLDEDAMGSNSNTKLATQQSIKSYIDNAVTGGLTHKGGYNAATNTPALDTGSPTIEVGDMYTVTAAGTFFTVVLEVGDVLISNEDSTDGASVSDWTIVQANIGAASETAAGYIEIASTAEADGGSDNSRAITSSKLHATTFDGGSF